MILSILTVFAAAVSAGWGSSDKAPHKCEFYISGGSQYAYSAKEHEELPKHWKYLYGEEKAYPRFKVDRVAPGAEVPPNAASRERWISKSDRFNIELLMKDYSLSRLQAAEVQAIYRRKHKLITSDVEFEKIILDVWEGRTMSGIDEAALRQEPAIVVLDLDGTLLDQERSEWHDGISTFSFKFTEKFKTVHVALAPGMEKLIRRLLGLKVPIVLYSRNSDYLVHALADFITIDGVPLRKLVAGVLSSSHMVDTGAFAQATETEQISSAHRLVRKDLRLLGSDNVIIVDDDQTYIRSGDHLRLYKVAKFDVRDLKSRADDAFRAHRPHSWEPENELKKKKRKKKDIPSYPLKSDFVRSELEIYEMAFEQIADDLAEAVHLARKYKGRLTFVEAALPYSYLLKEVMENLIDDERSGDYKDIPVFKDEVDARIWVRSNPTAALALIGKKKAPPPPPLPAKKDSDDDWHDVQDNYLTSWIDSFFGYSRPRRYED